MPNGTADSTFTLTENVKPEEAKQHLAEWLESGDARQAAWGAYYALRDRDTKSIPVLLAYVHKRGFGSEWSRVLRSLYSEAPERSSKATDIHAC